MPENNKGTADVNEPGHDQEVKDAQEAELEAERQERREKLGQ